MSEFEKRFVSEGNDYASLAERTGGDEELIAQLMQMFLVDESWAEMCAGMENGECEKAFRAAHSLKGSSGMLGFTALFDKMKVITDKLREGDIAGAKNVFEATRAEYEKAAKLVAEFV